MEKSDLNRLLGQYLKGELAEHERVKLEAWLEVMKTQGSRRPELSKEDEDELFRKITSNLNHVNDVIAWRPAGNKKFGTGQWVMRIAASLVIIIMVSCLLWYFTGGDQHRLEVVAKNNIEKVILDDGSLVWLHGSSKLVYYEKPEAGIRYGELQGEALFEVAKDASRPFLIRCGEVTIRVLGTSFSVKTNENLFELKVLTGRVNISSDADTIDVDVEPNEKVVFTGGNIEKRVMAPQEISSVTANTEYNMRFINASMEDVMERVESKFNVRVVFTSPAVSKCRITADLTDNSLERSLLMMQEVLNIEYNKKGNTIAISGSGCE